MSFSDTIRRSIKFQRQRHVVLHLSCKLYSLSTRDILVSSKRITVFDAVDKFLKFSVFFLFVCQMHSMAASGIATCETYIRQQENFYNIPPYLLKSVSLVESGRTIKPGYRVAWPWTINVNGKGYVYESKQQAINAVRKFQRQGETSIDVGCMQVNLKHHPTAFRHLDEAFDPQLNVAYAAQFLNNLKRQLGSWRTAVAHYHSASPQFHYPYREKIQKQWVSLRNSAGNMTPISHDVSYISNSATTSLKHPLMQQTKHKKVKPAQKSHDKAPVIAPPGKFYSINGTAQKSYESYAKVKYRKFYHVLPQNQSGFFPLK